MDQSEKFPNLAPPQEEEILSASNDLGEILRKEGRGDLSLDRSEEQDLVRDALVRNLVSRGHTHAAAQHALARQIELDTGSKADGPCIPYQWCYDGKKLDVTGGPQVWRLLDFLWGISNKSASFDELAEPVYEDVNEDVCSRSVSSMRTKANNFFKGNGIPWIVKIRASIVTLSPQVCEKT